MEFRLTGLSHSAWTSFRGAGHAEAAQLEQQQQQYRDQYGAKVMSLVAEIDADVTEGFKSIDQAVEAQSGLNSAIDELSFWGGLPPWYADQRLKGWELESTIPRPRDYGIAYFNGREVEAIVATINVLMKNRTLGDYKDVCWNVAYLIDREFDVHRQSVIADCSEDESAINEWKFSYGFETRWDLEVSTDD